MNLETVTSCPVCSATDFEHYLTSKDFTTTQESFHLVKCKTCDFVLTNPRPDGNSIGRYYQSEKYISHTGGGKVIIDKAYLLARRFTLRWKHELIIASKPTGSILDYGCGTGEFLHYMQERKWTVSGLEPTEVARQKASELLRQPISKSASEIGEQKFNVITLWHVLEHIHDLNETIRQLKKLLTEDGTLFIAVPNHESLDTKKYGAYWAAYDVPRHLWHFSKKTMKQLMSNHGLAVTDVQPMKLDAYYVSMLSESYKHPQQTRLVSLSKAFLVGSQSNLIGKSNANYSSLIYIVSK